MIPQDFDNLKDEADSGVGSISDASQLETYYTTDDLARHFRTSAKTIGNWIRVGRKTPRGQVRLDAIKPGRKWLVSRIGLEDFEHRVRPQVRRPDLDLEGPDEV